MRLPSIEESELETPRRWFSSSEFVSLLAYVDSSAPALAASIAASLPSAAALQERNILKETRRHAVASIEATGKSECCCRNEVNSDYGKISASIRW